MPTKTVVPKKTTYISQKHKKKNRYHRPYIKTGFDESREYRGLVQFNLCSLPDNINIASAVMSLYITENPFPNIKTFNAHTLLDRWKEKKVTWHNQPAVAAIPASATTFSDEVHTTINWALTSLVKSWYEGSVVNNGILLRSEIAAENNMVHFASIHNNDSTYWPRLRVTYTIPASTIADVNIIGRTCESYSESDLETTNDYLFTTTHDVSIYFTTTFFVCNAGINPAVIQAQISPDGTKWFNDGAVYTVAPGDSQVIDTPNYLQFLRLRYKSAVDDASTTINVLLQMQV